MPAYSRQQLRRDLGRLRLHDTIVGTNTASLAALTGTMAIIDPLLANPAMSGNPFFANSWFRCGSGPASGAAFDYRVATGNWYSGAALSFQMAQAGIASGMDYELAMLLSPTDKDRCIDLTISRFRVKQEVTIWGFDTMYEYSGIDVAASPNTILEVLNTYVFTNPAGSLDKQLRYFKQPAQVAMTASGTRVLRIPENVSFSQQIVMECLLQMTLGAGDEQTVTFPLIPDDQAILDSAAAYAYNLLIQNGPSQEVALYRQLRKEHATAFTDRMRKQVAEQNVQIGFDSIAPPTNSPGPSSSWWTW